MSIQCMKLFLILFLAIPTWLSLGEPVEHIDHAIGVYFSPKGTDYFRFHLKDLLDENGVNIGEVKFPEQKVELPEQRAEDFTKDPELKKAIKQGKDILNRILGIVFDKHKIVIELEGIGINVDWEKASIDIQSAPLESNYEHGVLSEINALIYIKGKNIKLKIDETDIYDELNQDLGRVHIDGFSFFQQEKSPSLVVMVPVTLKRTFDGFQVEFGEVTTNLDKVLLDYSYDSPLELPLIQVQIGQRKGKLVVSAVEQLLEVSKEQILQAFKDSTLDVIENKLPQVMTEKINGLVEGGLSEATAMEPPSAPKNKYVPSFKWSMNLTDLDYVSEYMHLGLEALIVDPQAQFKTFLPETMTATLIPDRFPKGSNQYDGIFTMNEGMINRANQLSFHRGYYDSFMIDGESVSMTSQPVMNIGEKRDPESGYLHKRGSMTLEISHTVTGLSAIAVKNPMKIQFDIMIDFPVGPDGKVSMKVAEVDPKSVFVADRYVRFFAGTVRKKAFEEVMSKEETLKGMVLSEALPIPEDLNGIPIKIKATGLGVNGHLLVFVDFEENSDDD